MLKTGANARRLIRQGLVPDEIDSFLAAFPSVSSNGLRHGLVKGLLGTMLAQCVYVGRSDNGAARRFELSTLFPLSTP